MGLGMQLGDAYNDDDEDEDDDKKKVEDGDEDDEEDEDEDDDEDTLQVVALAVILSVSSRAKRGNSVGTSCQRRSFACAQDKLAKDLRP